MKLSLPAAAALIVSTSLLLAGCADSGQPVQREHRAVVIVSGGAAVSPFTSNDEACASGLSAGNTDTALRESLIAAGYDVFTAPAMDSWGVVAEPDPSSFGAFGDCPVVLPEAMTINSTGDIDTAGEHLARFASYLNDTYGVTEIDWVGHSNGGLYARAATKVLQETQTAVTVGSLTTLGTPWMGSIPFRLAYGELTDPSCAASAICQQVIEALAEPSVAYKVLSHEQTYTYLVGDNAWNQAQIGVLDDIPVHQIGGGYLTDPSGDPEVWPFDGMVSVYSALGTGLPDSVAPTKTCSSYPLTHSIFFSDALGLDWQTALTWNTDVLTEVAQTIAHVREGTVAAPGTGCR